MTDLADAPLEDLLRRCHRRELLHLAAVLRVDARGKGLRDLAMALSRKLRWLGTHKLWALRRGEADSSMRIDALGRTFGGVAHRQRHGIGIDPRR